MMLKKTILPAFVLLVLFSFSFPKTAEAKSVVWSSGFPPVDVGDNLHLTSVNVSVMYAANLRNVSTGAILGDGEGIPVGTVIRLEPKPFEDIDITYFWTGSYYDSPYGFFRQYNPYDPNSLHYSASSGYDWYRLNWTWAFPWAPFFQYYYSLPTDQEVNTIVNPPSSISYDHNGSSAGLSCNGNGQECTVTSPGSIVSTVTFAATPGYIMYDDMNNDVLEILAHTFTVPSEPVSFNVSAFNPCAGNQGAACSSAPNACGQTNGGSIQCDGSCSASTPANSSCPAPTVAISVSPNPVPYGSSPTFTLSTTNGYYSHVLMDGVWDWNTSGYFTSGNFSPGAMTSPGVHSAWAYTYNSSWTGSGWAITNFTVLNQTCGNGANNPPTCNQCAAGYAYIASACVACGSGGCAGAGGNSGNPLGSLTCNNGANNPPSCNAFTPTATLSASPTTIDQGQSATLSWNSTNATACTGTGFTAGGPSGSRSTGALNTPGTQNYQVVCSGAGGSSAPAFASVLVLSPAATISASPARVVSGSNTTLSWSANGVTSCVVTGPSGTLASGNANGNHDFSTGSPMSVAITGQATFTITCQTNGAPVTNSVTANIIAGFREF